MFEKYLAEAKKIYEFNIGVAGECPDDFADQLETCLKRYSVASMSAGKKTPIQERPLDFPQLSNCEVTYYEVGLNYQLHLKCFQNTLHSVVIVAEIT